MLRGSLDDFSLFDVFGLIERGGKSGELTVINAAGQGRVRVWRGKVSEADSAREREPVGRKLVRAGTVTEPALRFALERRTQRDVPLGEALVRAGLITSEQRAAALREQIEEVVVDLFGSDPKDFTWMPGDETDVPDATLEIESLLSDVSIRLERLAAIRQRIPDNRATVSLQAVPPSHAAEIKVGADQWQLLVALSSPRTVADVVKVAGFDEFHVLDVVASLADAGLVEIEDAAPAPPVEKAHQRSAPPSPPPVETEGLGVEPAARVTPSETGARPERRQDTVAAPAARAERRPGRFKIALVCTGNRIRSPLAEAFLRSFARKQPLEVVSVGLRDLGSRTALSEVVEVAAELGVDVSRHRARPMRRGELADADLVIGFEWIHVERAVTLGGAPRSRVFTIDELASLLKDVVPAPSEDSRSAVDRAREMVSSAHALRLRSRITAGGELRDPLGGPASEYRESAVRIRDLCFSIATRLFGSAPRRQEAAAG